MSLRKILKKIITFLKEVKIEMRKVNWPTKEETWRYTLIVIGVSTFVAIFLGFLDFIYTTIIKMIL